MSKALPLEDRIHLSEEDFWDVVERTQMQEHSIRAAYLVLVKGHTQAEAGRVVERTRQHVLQAVRRVIRLYEERLPEDWEMVTVALPSDLADELKAYARQLRSRKTQHDGLSSIFHHLNNEPEGEEV